MVQSTDNNQKATLPSARPVDWQRMTCRDDGTRDTEQGTRNANHATSIQHPASSISPSTLNPQRSESVESRVSRDQSPSAAFGRRSSVPERSTLNPQPSTIHVSLLTAGYDKPYALGIASALTSAGVHLDFIGSDDLNVPELRNDGRLRFLNLRGSSAANASLTAKVVRVLRYYSNLVRYAAGSNPRIFHILWHNKFEFFDRTLLLLYYKLLRKKLVFTAHNVNAGKRDGNDSWLNRASLRIQYRLCHHIFVHTAKMKQELLGDFGVAESKVSVTPFGINNTVPNTTLASAQARTQLGLGGADKVILFFGNIAPYKGLEYLISAFTRLAMDGSPKSKVRSPKSFALVRDGESDGRGIKGEGNSADPQPSTLNHQLSCNYRLIIAGNPKNCDQYWAGIQQQIARSRVHDKIIQRIEYVPDETTEVYFKAADVLVLPYVYIFQSGVLFLAYSFGLPVIAADVGSLKEEIIQGETGFVSRPNDAADLAETIEKYFRSDLYRQLDGRRASIRAYANDRYSWTKVGAITTRVYSDLLQGSDVVASGVATTNAGAVAEAE